ncbi:MAG TPA: hypothetical protein VFE24_01255, partial [Pirellulales bacterium]|nr:hypothetical protein [Pirellulales bacterium]
PTPPGSKSNRAAAIDDFSDETAARFPGAASASLGAGGAPRAGNRSIADLASEWSTVIIGLRIGNYANWVALGGAILVLLAKIVNTAAPPHDEQSSALLEWLSSWGDSALIGAIVSSVTGWFVCRAVSPRFAPRSFLSGAIVCLALGTAAVLLNSFLPIIVEAYKLQTPTDVLMGATFLFPAIGFASFGFFLGGIGRFFADRGLLPQARWFGGGLLAAVVWNLIKHFFIHAHSTTILILLTIVDGAAMIGLIIWFGYLIRRAAAAIRRGAKLRS